MRPPLGISWPGLFGAKALSHKVHLRIARERWRRPRSIGKRAELVLRQLAYPFRAARRSYALTKKYATLADRTAKSKLRLFCEQLDCATRFSIPPEKYWLYRLYEPTHRGDAVEFLHRHETKYKGAFSMLRDRPKRRWLSDKEACYERCKANGIPMPVHYATCERGEIRWLAATKLPEYDLFVKPRIAAGGRGAQVYEWKGDGRFELHRGKATDAIETFTSDELIARWKEASKAVPLMIQERMFSHPVLRDLTGDALCTLRVLSCLDEDHVPEIIWGTFRMGRGTAIVDNFHAGGVGAAVNMMTGELSRATLLDPRAPWFEEHPDTHVRIVGRKLPDFLEAISIVEKAHHAFPEYYIIGWDVGFSSRGPVLIEGNSAPCVDLMQRTHDRGLCDTRLGELIEYHLARRKRRR